MEGPPAERVPLNAAILEGFVTLYLLERFDNPQPVPELHRHIWRAFTSDHPMVAIAAPRGHAKSSAGTHAYGLASILFGGSDHILIISATEKMAIDHLADISMELKENEAILSHFDVQITIDNETELIGKVGGRWFRVVVRGAEQRVRGIKWRHKRPNLILIDDLEEDEAVQNVERRIKLRDWIDNAVLPLGGDHCKIRALGTILHFDSWLERTMTNGSWHTMRFSAHAGFDDFSQILWPEKFPERKLRMIRQLYLDNNNPSGYSQEYLNHPISDIDSYFRTTDFTAMEQKHRDSPKNYYCGVDLAISKADRANQTAFVIGGVDPESYLNIVDCQCGRWDSLEIIDTMFRIQRQWGIDTFIIEKGSIEKSLGPVINMEMIRRGIFLNIVTRAPTKDKMARAQAIRQRMRAGGVRFDKEAPWYVPFEMELMQFPRSGKDDRVDAAAWLGLFVDEVQASLNPKELKELAREEELAESEDNDGGGRNPVTGY